MTTRPDRFLLSIVTPMYNEGEAVELFFDRVLPILDQLGCEFEIVCVNDGSADDTLEHLLARHRADERIKVIALSRNFGKDTALTAGLDHASGDAIIPIDADLQDPPELITSMVEKWKAGYDVVNARRVSRSSDTAAKRVTASAFYRVFNVIADHPIPENIGDFRLLDRKALDAVLRMPERDRFMKGLFAWVGFRTTEVDYERPSRSAGESKFSFWKLWRFAIGGITAFSTFPLRVWNYLGTFFAVASFLYAAFLITRTLIFGRDVPGYASIMVVVLFLGGIQLISLGVIGEYIGRIYNEAKRRPLYFISDTYGISAAPRRDAERRR